MSREIDALIRDLSAVKSRLDLFNPYAGGPAPANIRRENLHRYLAAMYRRRPRVALIGEAIGYQGGRMTGIPFLSERILREQPAWCPFGEPAYPIAGEFGRIWAEPTATMVWEAMRDLPELPLFWNGLPFHPHRPGRLLSNRPPRRGELALGRPFLRRVLELFAIERPVAVGNKAARVLADVGVDFVKIRHPSHGGKAAFRVGIGALAEWYAARG